MTFQKDEKNLIVKIPLKSDKYKTTEKIDNFRWVIEGNKCGFSYLVDASYESKSDQLTDMFLVLDYPPLKFRELCNEMGIIVYECPRCSRCWWAIFRCFNRDNDLCDECLDKWFDKVFICSPYRGNISQNISNARRYANEAVSEWLLPIVPHLYFPQFLNDNNPQERDMGIKMGIELLKDCEEVRVYWKPTEGMTIEINEAVKLKKKITIK